MTRYAGPGSVSAALRAAAPMVTVPVGAGSLIGSGGGQVAGLVGADDDQLAAHDAMLADHEARIGALEQAAHGHPDAGDGGDGGGP